MITNTKTLLASLFSGSRSTGSNSFGCRTITGVFVLLLSLIGLPLVAQTGSPTKQSGSGNATLEAAIKRREADIAEYKARLQRLTNSIETLRQTRLQKERQLKVLSDKIAVIGKMPHPTRVTQAEVQQSEAQAKQLTEQIEKLSKELKSLLAQRKEAEDKAKLAANKVPEKSDETPSIDRSKAALEEDLAKAEQTAKETEKQKLALQQRLKTLQERIGEVNGSIDSIGTQASVIKLKPKKVIRIVCRQQKLLIHDESSLIQQFIEGAKKFIAEKQAAKQNATWGGLETHINSQGIHSSICSLRSNLKT